MSPPRKARCPKGHNKNGKLYCTTCKRIAQKARYHADPLDAANKKQEYRETAKAKHSPAPTPEEARTLLARAPKVQCPHTLAYPTVGGKAFCYTCGAEWVI